MGVDQVTVVPGDTAGIARGQGTLASRSTVIAGTAIAGAAQDVGARLRELAADVLEASPADLELRGHRARRRHAESRRDVRAACGGETPSPNPPPRRGRGLRRSPIRQPAPPSSRKGGWRG